MAPDWAKGFYPLAAGVHGALTEREDIMVSLLPLTNLKLLESCTWVTWRMAC